MGYNNACIIKSAPHIFHEFNLDILSGGGKGIMWWISFSKWKIFNFMMILTQIQIYWKIFSFLGQGRLRTTAHFSTAVSFLVHRSWNSGRCWENWLFISIIKMISVCLMSLHQVKSLLNGHSLSNENYLNDCGRFN